MFTKKTLTTLASLALAKEAFAFNIHRVENNAVAERDMHVEVVTHWVTATVYAGQANPTPAPAPAPAAPEVVVPEVEEVQETHEAPAEPAPAAPVQNNNENSNNNDNNNQQEEKKENGFTTSGSKRGLAYNEAKSCSAFSGSNKMSWAWNWDSSANGLDMDLEFVPTLWGPIDIHTNRWKANADKAIEAGSTHLFSFNECDIPSQCNLNAGAAADAHVKWLNPYADKAKIGAPSVSNSNIGGQGLDWLQEWVDSCESKGCKYDFCNVHWYSPLNAAETLYDHIKEASKICGGKPVWLTEFAPLNAENGEVTPSEAAQWLPEVLKELDNLPELERYSYFMAGDGKLVSGSGLSSSGEAYA